MELETFEASLSNVIHPGKLHTYRAKCMLAGMTSEEAEQSYKEAVAKYYDDRAEIKRAIWEAIHKEHNYSHLPQEVITKIDNFAMNYAGGFGFREIADMAGELSDLVLRAIKLSHE